MMIPLFLFLASIGAVQTPPPAAPPIEVEINTGGGKELQLTDGTVWTVRPQDYEISSTWLIPSPLQITPSGDPDYPYRLTEESSQRFVFAKRK